MKIIKIKNSNKIPVIASVELNKFINFLYQNESDFPISHLKFALDSAKKILYYTNSSLSPLLEEGIYDKLFVPSNYYENIFIRNDIVTIPEILCELIFIRAKRGFSKNIFLVDEENEKPVILKFKKSEFKPIYDVFEVIINKKEKSFKKTKKTVLKEEKKSKTISDFQTESVKTDKKPFTIYEKSSEKEITPEELKRKKIKSEEIEPHDVGVKRTKIPLEILSYLKDDPELWLKLYEKYKTVSRSDSLICLVNAVWNDKKLLSFSQSDPSFSITVKKIKESLNNNFSELSKLPKKLIWLLIEEDIEKSPDYMYLLKLEENILKLIENSFLTGIDLPSFLKNIPPDTVSEEFLLLDKNEEYQSIINEINSLLGVINEKVEAIPYKNSIKEPCKITIRFDSEKFYENPLHPYEKSMDEIFKDFSQESYEIRKNKISSGCYFNAVNLIVKFKPEVKKEYFKTIKFLISSKNYEFLEVHFLSLYYENELERTLKDYLIKNSLKILELKEKESMILKIIVSLFLKKFSGIDISIEELSEHIYRGMVELKPDMFENFFLKILKIFEKNFLEDKIVISKTLMELLKNSYTGKNFRELLFTLKLFLEKRTISQKELVEHIKSKEISKTKNRIKAFSFKIKREDEFVKMIMEL